MTDILKLASMDSPAAVWIIFLFIMVFMGFLFYVALMDRNHAKDMAGKPLDDADLLLDHEIDGIRELDNDLPPWWLKLFYGSIIFSAVYFLGYHVVEIWNLPEAEYIREYKAKVGSEPTEGVESGNLGGGEQPVVLSEAELKAQALNLGKSIYIKNCSACHAADGGGGVGPNFCDSYWLHGGDKASVVKTITEGVPAKGMISWKPLLKEREIEAVADYVLSLQGTTPAAPKAPQGEPYHP